MAVDGIHELSIFGAVATDAVCGARQGVNGSPMQPLDVSDEPLQQDVCRCAAGGAVDVHSKFSVVCFATTTGTRPASAVKVWGGASVGRRMSAPHPIAAPAATKAPAVHSCRSSGAFLPNSKLAPTHRASVGAVFSGDVHRSALPGQPSGEARSRLPALTLGRLRQRAEMLGQLGPSGVDAKPSRHHARIDSRNHVFIAGCLCVSRVPHRLALQAERNLRRVGPSVPLHMEPIAQ